MQEPKDDLEIVRLREPKPLQLWVPTLDSQPIKSAESFDYDQRNREILFLGFVLLVIWVETHLLNSSYQENRKLNEVVAQKEAEKVTLITTMSDAFFKRMQEELKPVAEPPKEQPKPEPSKPEKISPPKAPPKHNGANNIEIATPVLPAEYRGGK